MPRAPSARRYAQAIFEIASEKNELDGWLDDLTLLARALENQELSEFLDSPQVTLSQKIEVIKDTLGNAVGPLALNLICLLASRGIVAVMHGIVEQYQRMLDAYRQIERAEVVSAVPLDSEQREKIVGLLSGVTGKQIRLSQQVEPGILGGLLARFGDRVIDGSTRTKLEAMRRGLAERLS